MNLNVKYKTLKKRRKSLGYKISMFYTKYQLELKFSKADK